MRVSNLRQPFRRSGAEDVPGMDVLDGGVNGSLGFDGRGKTLSFHRP